MLIQIFAALAVYAAAADRAEVYGWSHEVVSPRDAASAKELETALQRFERDLAGRRGTSAAGSKPREIVVVGSKVKDVVRSPGASGDGFSGVSGLKRETGVVEFRDGGPASLPQLQAAIRRFESAAGPRSPCIGKCRATGRQCLSRCRAALRKNRIGGRCVCEHVHARCLVQAARRGACHPPDPGRPRRR